MKVEAYVIREPGGAPQPFQYEAEPGPDEALVEVTHCGICHSDVHLADGDWGDVYPFVPGHEIVGQVIRGGHLSPGTRVGIGWQCGSCGHCEWCNQGKEVVCAEHQATCVGHYGGFASHVLADSRFVFPLPENLDSAGAAPLFCGGATVFTPLQLYASPRSRVAVIGIGGLGHLALQFAARLCSHVTAVSRSAEKREEAIGLGADEFLTEDPERRSFDLVLNTSPVNLDMNLWTEALRPEGVFVQLGAPPEPLQVPGMNLISGYRNVTGSGVAHPEVLRKMLEFASLHEIEARVEILPMKECRQAMEKTRSCRAKYRMVLAR